MFAAHWLKVLCDEIPECFNLKQVVSNEVYFFGWKILNGMELIDIFKRYFEGALFVDAGNIWRIKEDGRTEATFKFSEFYKQIAMGTGFGFRLNLDFLVFRIDWALPVMDPRKTLSKRFVLPNYIDPGILWDASILNFGVGYPF